MQVESVRNMMVYVDGLLELLVENQKVTSKRFDWELELADEKIGVCILFRFAVVYW